MSTLLLWQTLAGAGPQPAFNIDDLLKTAEVVAICTVTKVAKDGETELVVGDSRITCYRLKASGSVAAVLKGHAVKTIDVVFLKEKDLPVGLGGLGEGETAVLFLKKDTGGSWVFVDEKNPKLSLMQFYPKADVEELTPKARIERQLSAALDSNDSNEIQLALKGIASIGASVPETKLQALALKPDSQVRALALAALVKVKNAEAIVQVAGILQGKAKDVKLSKSDREALAWALESVADFVPRTVAVELAGSEDATVQRVGVRILRVIGDKDSIPVLLRALNSDNKDTQYSAIIALARVSGQKGCSWKEFMENPAGQVEKWKEWGNTNVPTVPDK